jgi:hypothetical protein
MSCPPSYPWRADRQGHYSAPMLGGNKVSEHPWNVGYAEIPRFPWVETCTSAETLSRPVDNHFPRSNFIIILIKRLILRFNAIKLITLVHYIHYRHPCGAQYVQPSQLSCDHVTFSLSHWSMPNHLIPFYLLIGQLNALQRMCTLGLHSDHVSSRQLARKLASLDAAR